jgi:hypothetical protein
MLGNEFHTANNNFFYIFANFVMQKKKIDSEYNLMLLNQLETYKSNLRRISFSVSNRHISDYTNWIIINGIVRIASKK